MKKDILYKEIGNIDDDLILEAAEARVKKRNRQILYRFAGIAACFCVICGGILLGTQRDTIYMNETQRPMISKVVVPDAETSEIVQMDYQELLAYYEMEEMPDTLGSDTDEPFTKTDQSFFVLYRDLENNIIYDTNNLYYTNTDNTKTLSITLAKVKEIPSVSSEDMKPSKIGGVETMLGAASNGTGYTAYWAEFKLNDISVKVISDGLAEDAFIDVITEFIQILK